MVIAPPGRRFDYENSCAATRRRLIGELTVAFGTAFPSSPRLEESAGRWLAKPTCALAPHIGARRAWPVVKLGWWSVPVSAEQLQEELEYVERVQEDRRSDERRRIQVRRSPQPLEVEHREPCKDDQTQDRVDDRTGRNVDEYQHDAEPNERKQRPEADTCDARQIGARALACGAARGCASRRIALRDWRLGRGHTSTGRKLFARIRRWRSGLFGRQVRDRRADQGSP